MTARSTPRRGQRGPHGISGGQERLEHKVGGEAGGEPGDQSGRGEHESLGIWAAYALITSTTRRPGSDRGIAARSVLDQRLARGEIDAAEYQRLRGLIASGDHQAPAGTGSRK